MIPMIIGSVGFGFFVGSSLLFLPDVGVWMIFGIMVFVGIAWIVDMAYQIKPGTVESQKLRYVVRPLTVVRVLRTKPGKSGLIAFIRQDGNKEIRRVILQSASKALVKGIYRIGYDYELHPCEFHEVIKKPVK